MPPTHVILTKLPMPLLGSIEASRQARRDACSRGTPIHPPIHPSMRRHDRP
jgi:hypothetical protein